MWWNGLTSSSALPLVSEIEEPLKVVRLLSTGPITWLEDLFARFKWLPSKIRLVSGHSSGVEFVLVCLAAMATAFHSKD